MWAGGENCTYIIVIIKELHDISIQEVYNIFFHQGYEIYFI